MDFSLFTTNTICNVELTLSLDSLRKKEKSSFPTVTFKYLCMSRADLDIAV